MKQDSHLLLALVALFCLALLAGSLLAHAAHVY